MLDYYWPTCPICGCPIVRTGDQHDYDDKCPLGHYSYSFSYGLHEEVVNEDVFGWTWDGDNLEAYLLRRHRLNEASESWYRGEYV